MFRIASFVRQRLLDLVFPLLVFTFSPIHAASLIPGREILDTQNFRYETLSPEKGNVIMTSNVIVETMSQEHYRIIVVDSSESLVRTETVWGNHTFGDSSWTVTEVKRGSTKANYSGYRIGKVLTCKGMIDGESVNESKTAKDGRPLFFNPFIGLQRFSQSQKEQVKFWVYKPDGYKSHELVAERLDEQVIQVAGKKIQAIKVSWGLPTPFKSFFQNDYWFGKSDGIFLKAENHDNSVIRLVALPNNVSKF